MHTAVNIPPLVKGGMAPWQIRRIFSHIELNIENPIRVNDLARVVNMSSGHLSRTFKRSLGLTLHRYIMQKRVERARTLMLSTSDGLSLIARTCGLCDQAHLTRAFRRMAGETPARWRRARWEPADAAQSTGVAK